MEKKFELGITTFGEVMPNPKTGETLTYDERIRLLIDEIVLAEEVGLDYFGIGEHHREDFAVSAPHMVLAGAATRTSKIKLGSAVTVLSSDDPIRVYQNFATLQALSNGRAEIMAGRGSFVESFPLFGYDLKDYDQLFAEKLDLLTKVRDHEVVHFEGDLRPSIDGIGVYPRNEQKIPISVAVGGTPASVIRAAKYGLPLFLAIIGGEPLRFKALVDLYKKHYLANGYKEEDMFISVHSHGYITEDYEQAVEEYYPSVEQLMTKIGIERGWGPYNRSTYKHALSMDGALYVGDPAYVAKKINYLKEHLGINRFTMHVPVGYMDHEKVLKTIELLGEQVRPLIK
jgi:probable LLM family oxidoreductase